MSSLLISKVSQDVLQAHRTLMLLLDEFDEAANRADVAEAQVEDLKLQLDDALGAEDMLEQLTDRNLTLSEVSRITRACRTS